MNQDKESQLSEDRFYKPKKRFEVSNESDLEAAFNNLTVHGERHSNGNSQNFRGGRRPGRGHRGGRGRVQESYMRSENQRQAGNRKESWKQGLQNLGENNENGPGDNDPRKKNNHGDENGKDRKENKQLKMVKGRNTVQFKPSYAPPDLRIVPALEHWKTYQRPYSERDVVIVNGLFCLPEDMSIYNQLLDEIESSGVDGDKLWQLWHNDSHLIADDKLHWKKHCPTFNMVLERMIDYFGMDVKSTRFNWYRNSTEWKPFHHDAAAVKPDKAKSQNLTLAVSFGMEREVAFEHAKTKSTIAIPQPNGSLYAFGKDVNVTWRHGIPAIHPKKFVEKGRISIIAWGWIDKMVDES